MRQSKRYKKENERDFKKVIKYSVVLLILIILVITFCIIYINTKNGKRVAYTEKSKVNYEVLLNENDFFKGGSLGEQQQYISSLIKNINANFEYDMSVNEELDYNCTYKIDAILEIKEKNTKNTLYKHEECLLEEKNIESQEGKVNIAESVEIDFNKFNDMANKFVTKFNLSSKSDSKLTVNLIVKNDKKEDVVTALSLPLVEQTIAVSTNAKMAKNNEIKSIVIGSNKTINKVSLLGLVLSLFGAVYFSYKLVNYLKETDTEKNKYKNEIKKILLNYGEYINKTDDHELTLADYKIVRMRTFVDLLKVTERTLKPILMIENVGETNTTFAIIGDDKILFMFSLSLHQELLAEKNKIAPIESKEEIGVGANED